MKGTQLERASPRVQPFTWDALTWLRIPPARALVNQWLSWDDLANLRHLLILIPCPWVLSLNWGRGQDVLCVNSSHGEERREVGCGGEGAASMPKRRWVSSHVCKFCCQEEWKHADAFMQRWPRYARWHSKTPVLALKGSLSTKFLQCALLQRKFWRVSEEFNWLCEHHRLCLPPLTGILT